MELISKFRLGEKVYYKPKLSGFNNKKPLIIDRINYKKTDELSESLGVKFNPTFMYHFKDSNLGSIENDLTNNLCDIIK